MHATAAFVAAATERIDRSHSWIWPEGYEAWFGSIASILIFALLVWKGGPFVTKAMRARTTRVQTELDDAAADRAAAESEAATIRTAKGDIATERQQMLAAADEQAAAILADGRARLEREVVELEAKAGADIRAAMSRSRDELRLEIARLASAAADRVIAESLDGELQQRLIDDFIAGVGTGANQ